MTSGSATPRSRRAALAIVDPHGRLGGSLATSTSSRSGRTHSPSSTWSAQGPRGFIREILARAAANSILRLLGAAALDRVDAGCFQTMQDAVEDGELESVRSSRGSGAGASSRASSRPRRRCPRGQHRDRRGGGGPARVQTRPGASGAGTGRLDRTWVLPRRTKREPEHGRVRNDERQLARSVDRPRGQGVSSALRTYQVDSRGREGPPRRLRSTGRDTRTKPPRGAPIQVNRSRMARTRAASAAPRGAAPAAAVRAWPQVPRIAPIA